MRRRAIRLWPLYALGLFVTIAAIAASFRIGVNTNWTPGSLLPASLLSLLFIPTWSGDLDKGLFPLNVPAWSLLMELFVNVVFAVIWPILKKPVLITIIIVSGILTTAVSLYYGSLNVGYCWYNSVGGVPRVFFGFMVGVFLARNSEHLPSIRLPAWSVLVGAGVFLLIDPGSFRLGFDVLAALLISPLLVYVGSLVEPGRVLLPVFSSLGIVSYAIYVLHIPALGIYKVVVGKALGEYVHPPVTGIIFLTTLVVGCLLADKVFDIPVRAYLEKVTRRK